MVAWRWFFLLASLLSAGGAWSQAGHGCGPIADSDFRGVVLATNPGAALDEPLKMAFNMDAQGGVDIYFVERKGKLKKYAAATQQVATLGSVRANSTFEEGLTGIALDPGFKSNRWVYLYYAYGKDPDFQFRVSRFTLGAQDMLDTTSEKVVLSIPAIDARMHAGGTLQFDAQGDLWITVGESAAPEDGAGNSNDLRGKILRIHPLSDGTYSVPLGNLFPKGTEKTRPEIYVMGVRNAYTLAMDNVRKRVAWGDIGPDGRGVTEEHNLTDKPGFFGWPYFAGNNVIIMGAQDPAGAMNTNAKNTGIAKLPPAQVAINSYAQAAAITGPIYHYDAASASKVKMPPHFHDHWFVADFNLNTMDTITLNDAGTAKLAKARVFPNIKVDKPIDFQAGPDGALYVLNYSGWFNSTPGTSILRIEYTGSCHPVGISPSEGRRAGGFALKGWLARVEATGGHTFQVLDMRGSALKTFQGHGAQSYDVKRILDGHPGGLYVLRLIADGRTSSRTLVWWPR